MLRSDEHLHRYEEIARVLRHRILRREFGNDGRLPAERVLGEQFQVQRNTVRQALALLEKEGHIVTNAKRGSFVRLASPDEHRNVFLVSIHGDALSDLNHLVDGFGKVAKRAGYSIRRLDTDPPKGWATDVIPSVDTLPSDTAGVILWPQNPTDVEALARLNASIPLVLVDRRVMGLSVDCVHFDDVAGGRMVAEHLLSQGHRRIAFLTDEVFAETVQQRWRGYATALEAANVPVDPELGLFFRGIDQALFAIALRHLFSLGDQSPTAIMCSNDIVAFTLLRFLRDEGIRVPEDVAVTGYGNSMPDYLDAMALTSVDQPFSKLGQTAAGILLDRVHQLPEERIHDPADLLIPVRLVVRGSSVRQVDTLAGCE